MINLANKFAHGGEDHADTAAGFGHLLENAGFAVATWILLIAFTLILGSKIPGFKRPQRLLATAALHLVFGVYLYDKSPAIGALVVSAGFALTLGSVLLGIQDTPATKQDKENQK